MSAYSRQQTCVWVVEVFDGKAWVRDSFFFGRDAARAQARSIRDEWDERVRVRKYVREGE